MAIALSGRAVDVLVGPAGAGKTTAMNALRRAWETEHGTGSVVGLAPSAVAAQVLAEDLSGGTENTAKWLHDFRATGATFAKGQLVIVDEASLAGTFTLDQITQQAEQHGAKVLMVGDWAQLQSVDAGGAFAMLVNERPDAPELTDVHRFTHPWEKTSSLDLRHGRASAIDTLMSHGRIHGGEEDVAVDAAYAAWRRDQAAGRASILVAETQQSVTALNQRARADRIIDGTVNPTHELPLHDGSAACEGDLVITRRNDRGLRSGNSWVRNGDRWAVTGFDGLENLDTSHVTYMRGMFSNSGLREVGLGAGFRFIGGGDAAFPEAGTDGSGRYTGKWVNVGSGTVGDPRGSNVWDAGQLMASYDGSRDADTYVWQPKAPVASPGVTVRYVDEQGNRVHADQSITGDVGGAYDASTPVYRLDVRGYTLDESKLPANAKGALSDKMQTVVYTYRKTPAPAPNNNGGNANANAGGSGSLAATGASIALASLGGVLLLAAGVALLWRRRRA